MRLNIFAKGSVFIFLSLFGASLHAQEVLPQDCSRAELFLSANKHSLAESYAELCQNTPNISKEVFIFATFIRGTARVNLNKPEAALSDFETLISEKYATSPIYSRKSNGIKALGATQPLLLAQASRLAINLNKPEKALLYANRSLTLARLDPSVHIDVLGEAYMLRARLGMSGQDKQKASLDIMRAYIRGSKDPWVAENMKLLPPEHIARIDDLRKLMVKAYAEYLGIYSLSFVSAPRTLAELKTKGDQDYQAVLKDETAYLGPDY